MDADFPWIDPADTGYTVEEFDPERDTAPAGGPDDCSGHEEEA